MSSAAARKAYNERLAAAMRADPNHPMHGTATGYRASCRCIGAGSCTEANARDQLHRRLRA